MAARIIAATFALALGLAALIHSGAKAQEYLDSGTCCPGSVEYLYWVNDNLWVYHYNPGTGAGYWECRICIWG